MKKYMLSFLFAMMLCLLPCVVYAAPLDTVTEAVDTGEKELSFCITSGIDLTKEVQSTFDSTRMISGTTLQGTGITIQVSTKDAVGEVKDTVCYTMEVGASGLFSETIALGLGENAITITAQKDGYKEVCQSVTIKRKKLQIKTELENTISIPGSGRNTLLIIK
ncbi:MAG: hypothetical protein GX299_02650 [Epulopiscium sp.]|nr:hypothetical protein [Candidatus Epulonipiscium sp.]